MRRKNFLLFCLIWIVSARHSVARFKDDLQKLRINSNYEISVPIFMWHNRYTYDEIFHNYYNEFPLGIGLGKWMKKDNHFHSILFSVFLDSYKRPETYFGYFFRYYLFNNHVKFYIGATIGLTQRRDLFYLPIPIPPLPILGVEISKLYIELSYIPGKRNFGNILTIRIGFFVQK